MRDRAFGLRNVARRNAALDFARNSAGGLVVAGDELDRRPWLLACRNGVIDLRTGDLRPGRQDDYLTMAAAVDYPGLLAPAPLWERTLLEIFNYDEEVVSFIRRALGYGLLGEVQEDILLCLMGPGGRNGKTVLIENVSRVLGPLASPIPSEMLLRSYRPGNTSGPTPDIMALKGLRLAYAAETEDGAALSAAKVKWLTGKDRLVGRSPHDKFPCSFDPSHMIVLSTNFRPKLDSEDGALWERLLCIPFKMRFVRREPSAENERLADIDLMKKLSSEGPAILAWLVRGCIEWQETGLAPPPAVQDEVKAYFEDEDSFGWFLHECCHRGAHDQHEAFSSDLYEVLCLWWKKNIGQKMPSQTKLGRYLKSRFACHKSGRMLYRGISIDPVVHDELRNAR
jgi:putative DNA primase/helicase